MPEKVIKKVEAQKPETAVIQSETKGEDAPTTKRGRKKKRKGYFYEEEEAAFIAYCKSTDQRERDRIFRTKLYPAFTKMIESIIRRYELFTPSEDFKDTFNECMSFLMTKVNNYDVTKGYKVYSYCGTIVKNHLILKRRKDMKARETNISYEMMFPDKSNDTRADSTYEQETLDFTSSLIQKTLAEIKDRLERDKRGDCTVRMSENERKVGYGLVEILENWEDLFQDTSNRKFNRTSVRYFLQEFTMLSPKQVNEGLKYFTSIYQLTKHKALNSI